MQAAEETHRRELNKRAGLIHRLEEELNEAEEARQGGAEQQGELQAQV